jgi:dehydrogenase/reductase SDR family protein 1
MSPNLKENIALVTGGSRGVGKGIALGLGEAGATVYITGRTIKEGAGQGPGTITGTADEVTRLGGQGIAVRCDHSNDAEVEGVFQRIQNEQGRLDILVNNVFALPDQALPDQGLPMGVPFWQLPLKIWDSMHTIGLRSHYVASVFAARIMVPQHHGFIANISSHGGGSYLFNTAYGVGKAGVDKLTADTAYELREHNVAVVSLWPGLMKAEWIMAIADQFDMSIAHSPQFTGRAVAALAADPNIMDKSGKVYVVGDLASEYGFTDPEDSLAPTS